MALDEMFPFARNAIFPSWFTNSLQKLLSTYSADFAVTILDPTHIQVIATADPGAAVISVAGRWRWIEASINRAHPGGAAGTYDIYVTAKENKIVETPLPGTDTTDYSFALRIMKSGETPAIEAGVVEIFRKVGSLQWSGAAITRVDQTAPLTPTHAHRHAAGGVDPLAPGDIGAPGFPPAKYVARTGLGSLTAGKSLTWTNPSETKWAWVNVDMGISPQPSFGAPVTIHVGGVFATELFAGEHTDSIRPGASLLVAPGEKVEFSNTGGGGATIGTINLSYRLFG